MRRPDLLAGSASAPAGFARTRLGLLAAAFLAPFSATHLVGSLTVGRAAALAFAVLLLSDLLRRRPPLFRLDLPALLLLAGYLGLCAWALASATTVGCNCEGKLGGLYELALVGLLALAAIGFEPRLRGPALLATLSGLTLAAVLALAGFGSLNSGTVDLSGTGGRLSGVYGNANELGLAAALAIPIALAYGAVAPRRLRLACGAAILILGLALALTYSRGGIIAAGAGAVALALWESRGSRRRLALIAGGVVVAVVLGLGLYSAFEDNRESASFESVPVTLAPLDRRDASGWDTRASGPIPSGPSRARNGADGIGVVGREPGQGLSVGWGEARPGEGYQLRFRARGQGQKTRLAYALGDRVEGRGARGSGTLDGSWQTFSLRWHPRRRAPHAALFLWQPQAPARFTFAGVRLLAIGPDGERTEVPIPPRLEGSIYDYLTSVASRSEERYLESRLDAARLAWRAFRSAPVQGIGWSTFPDYSAERLDYGRLAAHDQYLLVAAELGLIGLVFLALLIAAPIAGLRRAPSGWPTSAAVGTLAAAAAGVIFVEVLAAPQLAIPIAIAAAVLVAPPASAQSERTRSATSTPSPREAIASR